MTQPDNSAHRTIVLLVGTMMVGFTAGGCGPHRHPRPPEQGPPPGSGITDQDRNLAMLSIHAHAFWPDRNFHGADFIPLDKAIETLRMDEGPGAASRVRRAVAKLWGYGYGRSDFHDAIKVLLAKYRFDFDAYNDKLSIESRRRVPAIPLPPPDELKPILENVIVNDLVGLTGDCPYHVPTPSGGVGSPPPVKWSYDALIPRSVADIARSLDPQSWSVSTKYFNASYLVQTPSSCCSGSATPDCGFTAQPGKPKVPQAGPVYAAGQPYGKRAYYESLCIGKGCPDCNPAASCSASFKTLLCVGTSYDICAPFSWLAGFAGSYTVTYDLATALYADFGGDESDDVTIRWDHGTLSATAATTAQKQGLSGNVWSLVHVEKTLDFKGKSIPVKVGVILKAFEAELRDQVVNQACYPVPAECWFSLLPP